MYASKSICIVDNDWKRHGLIVLLEDSVGGLRLVGREAVLKILGD
jgi:hypothetical protein